MAEDNPNCSVCGAELEGSDVYEGLCHKCREDQVLGRPASARKAPRPAAPPPLRPAAPPPLTPHATPEPGAIAIETDVDTDADTREMLALQEAAAELPAPSAPSAPSGTEAGSIPFVEFQPSAADAPASREPAARPAQATRPVPPPAQAEPPDIEIAPLTPEPEILRLRPHAAETEFEAGEEPAPARPAPPRSAPRTAPRQAPPPAGHPPRRADEPVVLSLHAPEEEPKPRLAAECPLRIQDRLNQTISVELRAMLDRLSHDVEEVTARLRGSAGLAMTPRQQVGFGFRAFFGFLLGGVLFALAGIGFVALAGLLFHPPALAFLKRLLSSILGTP